MVNEAREELNSWIEKATNGLIIEILPNGSLGESTSLVLANAMYFKGAWNRRFDASATRERAFHLPNGETVRVPFMTSNPWERHLFRYFDNFKVLKLPYVKGHDKPQFSMYFFLPDERDGLPDLIEKFNADTELLNLKLREEELRDFGIPRFKISYEFKASEAMKELGVALPFLDSAELTEMANSDCPPSRKLRVSDIFHKSSIEVNEEGTEAAATTITQLMQSGSKPTFVADRSCFLLGKR